MSIENLTTEVIDDLIDSPLLLLSGGSNQDTSPNSSQSSLTKHLDTTNNYNSQSFQQFNNESSLKQKTILKTSDNGNNLVISLKADGNKSNHCINSKNPNNNISIDLVSSEEDTNHEFENILNDSNVNDFNYENNAIKKQDETRIQRNSDNSTKIISNSSQEHDREIVYDQINEIITKIKHVTPYINLKYKIKEPVICNISILLKV